MRARQPGTFLLRTVVRDATSHKMGSASQYVEVPDTRKGRIGMTGLIIRQANAEVAKMVGPDKFNVDESWTQGGPAIRRFRPGQGIMYGFGVINPKLKGSEKKSAIVSSVRIYWNGRLIYTGPETHKMLKNPDAENQLQGGGVLRLGEHLVPGEYLLQVVVRDENGSKKAPPLTQWIDFEVTES
jgi:hypothetical protein